MNEGVQKIDCAFVNEGSLYLAYMPFVKGGGLFIRSNLEIVLGTNVVLSIHLLNEPEVYSVEAQVIWVTPRGAQCNKPAGVGMQFTGNNGRAFSNKIETYLAGMLKSTQMTDTM